MRSHFLIPAVLLSLYTGGALAETSATPPTSTPTEKSADASSSRQDSGSFCFFSSVPATDKRYIAGRKLKLGKGTYGSVLDILPRFVERAKSEGADAIINYNGSQRFGFWPWRFVRPVVTGTTIKWIDPGHHDCASLGGKTLDAIAASTEVPAP